MRLQTASLLLLMSILWVQYAVAQYVQTNPLEWMALAEGNEAINGEIESQTDGQLRTAPCRIPLPPSLIKSMNGNGNTAVTCKRPAGMLPR